MKMLWGQNEEQSLLLIYRIIELMIIKFSREQGYRPNYTLVISLEQNYTCPHLISITTA